ASSDPRLFVEERGGEVDTAGLPHPTVVPEQEITAVDSSGAPILEHRRTADTADESPVDPCIGKPCGIGRPVNVGENPVPVVVGNDLECADPCGSRLDAAHDSPAVLVIEQLRVDVRA